MVVDDDNAVLLAARGRGSGNIPGADVNKVGLGQASVRPNMPGALLGSQLLDEFICPLCCA